MARRLSRAVTWGVVILFLFWARGVFSSTLFFCWGRWHGVKVSLSPLGDLGTSRAVFRNVRLDSPQGERSLVAPRMEVTYNLSRLFKQGAASAVSEIVLENPSVYLRRNQNGEWLPLFPPGRSTFPVRFKPRLLVRQSRVFVTDERWRRKGNPWRFVVHGIDGTLEFQPPVVKVNLTGKGSEGNFHLTGSLLISPLSGMVRVQASRLPLTLFGNYLLHQNPFQLTGGEASGRLSVLLSSPLSFQGSFSIRNASFSFEHFPALHANRIRSELSVSPALLRFRRVAGTLGESPFHGEGVVIHSRKQSSGLFSPALSFRLESSRFAFHDFIPLSDVIRSMGPSGKGRVEVHVSGTPFRLLWEGSAASEAASFNGDPVRHLSLRYSLIDQTFFLEEARFEKNGGSFSARGIVGDSVALVVEGSRVPFPDLSILRSLTGAPRFVFLRKTGGTTWFKALLTRLDKRNVVVARTVVDHPSFGKFQGNGLRMRLLFDAEKGWADQAWLDTRGGLYPGSLAGKGAWYGHGNPFLAGVVRGVVRGIPMSLDLFGDLENGFAIGSPLQLGWHANRVTGSFLIPSLAMEVAVPGQGWGAKASSSGLFDVHGHQASLYGTGSFKPYASHLQAQESGLWSLAFDGRKGAILAVSPSAVLAGMLQNTRTLRSAFLARTRIGPLHLFALGRLEGDGRHPHLEFSGLGNGWWGKHPFRVEGEMISDLTRVGIRHASALLGRGIYDLSGGFSLSPGTPLSLEGEVAEGEIVDLIRLFPGTLFQDGNLRGKISGHFRVRGSLKKPEGEIHLFARDAALFGQEISMAYADAVMDKKGITFNPLVARFRENYLTARGSVNINGFSRMAVEVSQVSLSDLSFLRRQLGLVTGTAGFRGTVHGSLRSPELSGTFEALNVQAGRLRLDRLRLKGRLADNLVEVAEGEMVRHGGIIAGSGSYRFSEESPYLSGNLSLSGVKPASFLSLPALESFGALNGKLFLSGPLSGLDGEFRLDLERANGISGQASGVVQGSQVSFSSLNLQVGEGSLSGKGSFLLDKASRVQLSGENLDLGLLGKLFGARRPLGGRVSLHGEVVTSLKNPVMGLEVMVTNPVLGPLFASTFSGKIVYRNGFLSIKNGQATQGGGTLKISGMIPVSATQSAPLVINLRLDSQDLGFLSSYLPGIKASGPVSGQARIAGTRGRYVLDGRAVLKGGRVLLSGMGSPIEEMNGSLDLSENNLRLEMSGTLGNPFKLFGAFQVNGTNFGNWLGDGKLEFAGSGSRLSIPSLARIEATSDLTLSRSLNHWRLSGESMVEDGEIRFSGAGGEWFGKLFPHLGDLELDTTLKFREGVKLSSSRFEVQGGGLLKFSGTLLHPQLAGELSGKKGTLNFLGHSFEITRGEAAFSPSRALPYLSLETVSIRRIHGSRIYLNLSGYPGNLRLQLYSDPPLTQEELSMTLTQQQPRERYLSGGANQFMEQEVSRWLKKGVQSEVFYPVERVFGTALNLEYFSVDLLPSGQIGIQIGKDISPHLTVTYSRAITPNRLQTQATPEAVWGLEYHLSPRILFRTTQDSVNGYGGQVLARWRF